ncbi:MAG TPA: hypothetical protein VMS18_28475 [Candidatus Binatia bacterium]|nr:hypothetical protein [Candidatus Binatia bacterium]
MSTESSWRLDWILGVATVFSVVGTVVGHRVSLGMEDVSFGLLLILLVLFVAMSWWRMVRAWKDGAARWRVWVSLTGCVALLLAFGMPLVQVLGSITFGMGFGPRWDYKLLMVGFGSGSLVLGVASARGVRFPLIAGGTIIALVGLILPVGV